MNRPQMWNQFRCCCVRILEQRNHGSAVKKELEQVREWTRDRLQSGAVPDWSWSQHVNLLDAIDALLHDMSVPGAAEEDARMTGGETGRTAKPSRRQAGKPKSLH
jgi:hypothetical protein